jgi:glycosyltransferase involved in cell wall biosynthesis
MASQDYPKKLTQVIVADGGSTDKTLQIIKKYPFVKLIRNPFRIEEKAKPLAIRKYARGEIIAFIDADNILPNKDFFTRMMSAFDNPEVDFADTLSFTVRKSDDLITRYNALIGGDDPIASYLHANDRLCYFNNRIIGNAKNISDKGDYYLIELDKNNVPAVGSNGFFFRKKLFSKVSNDPLNHTVFIRDLASKGYVTLAKVKQGIVHKQDGKLSTFFKKKLRRVKRRSNLELKRFTTYGVSKKRIILLSIYILTIILPVRDSIVGFIRKPDSAWLIHPFVSLALLFLYGYYYVRGIELESE